MACRATSAEGDAAVRDFLGGEAGDGFDDLAATRVRSWSVVIFPYGVVWRTLANTDSSRLQGGDLFGGELSGGRPGFADVG